MGGAARAAIDIPAPQAAAIAATSPPNHPPGPAELKQPRLEPQAVVGSRPACAHSPGCAARVRQAAVAAVCRRTAGHPAGVALKAVALPKAPVEGNSLVRPDGTIGLGVYGNVYVAGLTLDEARDAIANQLHVRLDKSRSRTLRRV